MMVNCLQNRGEDVLLCFVEKDVEKREEQRCQSQGRRPSPTCPHHWAEDYQLKTEGNWSPPRDRNMNAALYLLLGRVD